MWRVPSELNLPRAREEFAHCIFPTIDQLFGLTGIDPSQVDILVTNVSIFNTIPSLASVIVNRYKLRCDIESYHLGGQGCSASAISLHLIQQLLQVRLFFNVKTCEKRGEK